MLYLECSWIYGVESPRIAEAGKPVYGGFIRVKTPSKLPEDLECLIALWVSLSTEKYFYQTT